MATLVLQTVGALAGQFIGGPIGAALGQAAGAAAGAAIDQRLFAPKPPHVRGPRLTALNGVASTEGAPVPRVYGRARLGGQMIWATRFEESTVFSGGGKGGSSSPKQTSYYYYANFAIGLCEGPIAEVRRIWADGRELDQTRFNIRVYRGDETQAPDSLILAKEGAADAPSYRGLAYVVFERMPLEDFGNRVPQLAFETIRPLAGLGEAIRALDLAPGDGEFACAPAARYAVAADGSSRPVNRHMLVAESDWTASLDQAQTLCPALGRVSLSVAWFGDDLRANKCSITPRVERKDRSTSGETWTVADLTRESARAASLRAGEPAHCGTPSDASVRAAIADLNARGLAVAFHPLVAMDIPAGNGLTDPWTSTTTQPAYPWRGRIVCDPAPGRAGSVNGSPALLSQVNAFFGSTTPGANEWSYRRFILHYARLCRDAGGVDAFLIGSELAGLTRLRIGAGWFPVAEALARLAADAKSILGAQTKVSYLAHWTEYGGQTDSAGADLYFPLDGVWAAQAIDAVAIAFRPPLSDWREGECRDAALAATPADRAYLRARVAGGEGFDWAYPTQGAREAQERTPLIDAIYGVDWAYRPKDLVSWWSNPHVARRGGVLEPDPSAWKPRSKPVWLMGVSCPAVDRGANAPDAGTTGPVEDRAPPPFSRGFRDDLIQARAVEAIVSRFDPQRDDFVQEHNPLSPLYGGRMVDPDRIYVGAWDLRPYPAFPLREDAWRDAARWRTGPWLNGRLESAPLDAVLRDLCGQAGLACEAQVHAMVEGFVLERMMSPRAALEQLVDFFALDAVAAGGLVRFSPRGMGAVHALTLDDLVEPEEGEAYALTRGQESEIPSSLSISFFDGEKDYEPATARSRRLETGSRREGAIDVAIVTTREEAQRRCDIWLQDAWRAREQAHFALRPALLSLEIGDMLRLPDALGEGAYRIERILDGAVREIEARAIEPQIFDHPPPAAAPRRSMLGARLPGPPLVAFVDLALARGDGALQYVAAHADPWPGALAVWRRAGDGFAFVRTLDQAARIGETLDALGPGVVGRLDRLNEIRVQLYRGGFASQAPGQAFGANLIAVEGEGGWEALAFLEAEAVEPHVWRLRGLVRGLGGQESLAARMTPAGARLVALDAAVVPLVTDVAAIGVEQTYRIGPYSAGHGDANVVERVARARDIALRPYAPARMSAKRSAAGVTISLVRRTRIDGDAWSLVEAPLGEETERYEIDVLRLDGGFLRTLSATQPSALYPAAAEKADFGSAQSFLRLRAFQLSVAAGRGFAGEATLAID